MDKAKMKMRKLREGRMPTRKVQGYGAWEIGVDGDSGERTINIHLGTKLDSRAVARARKIVAKLLGLT